MTLTAERLRELLHYDPETGVFRRLADRGPNGPAGAIAGNTNAQGYVIISIDHRAYRAHRLAFLYMTGRWPGGHVDHRDGQGDNNRWSNLRPASATESSRNRRGWGSSGLKGVWTEGDDRWRARIYVNSIAVHLGCFRTAEDASAAYAAAASVFFGEFARGA